MIIIIVIEYSIPFNDASTAHSDHGCGIVRLASCKDFRVLRLLFALLYFCHVWHRALRLMSEQLRKHERRRVDTPYLRQYRFVLF
jgi:hypothetical protein